MWMRLLGLTVVVLAALTPSAHAGVLSVTTTVTPADKYYPESRSDSARYVAGPGEANVVQASIAGQVLTLSDTAGATPAVGCTAVSATVVRCPVLNSFNGIKAALGDLDDRFVSGLGASLDGGPGDDMLSGGTVRGGPGDDVLAGFEVEGGPGSDRLDAPTVSYADATGPVRIDLATRQAAGDQLSDAVINVIGGRFDDELIGDARNNRLDGGSGDDLLIGRDGDDAPYGAAGDDVIQAGRGNDTPGGGTGDDRIDGGPGTDTIFGDRGRDRIQGGAGLDVLSGDEGADRIDGGPGNDYLDGYYGADELIGRGDGAIDTLSCGPPDKPDPHSLARPDTRDLVRGCGHIRRATPARAILATARQDTGRPSVRAEIGCSQDVRNRCRGTLVLEHDGRTLDRARVRLAPKTGRGFRLHVPPTLYADATRDCGVLTVQVRFGRSSRHVVLTADDAKCSRTRPGVPFSITNW